MDAATDADTDTATDCISGAAVKSPLGAQTVLGDRHDPVVRCSIANSVGRLRNSPERTFQRLGTQTQARQKTNHGYSHRHRVRFRQGQHSSALCQDLLSPQTQKRHHFRFPRRAFDPGDPGGTDLFGASSGESSLTSIKF